MKDDRYLVSMEPLATSDAVVALILVDGRRYLLQLRDESPGIFFPGHWGTFGGALDRGETFLQGLRRELFEELELEFEEATYFTSFDIDYSFAGLCVYRRAYYVVDIKEEALAGLTLHEGTAMRAFTFEEIQTLDKVTPYDGFAVWLHMPTAGASLPAKTETMAPAADEMPMIRYPSRGGGMKITPAGNRRKQTRPVVKAVTANRANRECLQ